MWQITTPEQIKAFFDREQKAVVTFSGFSGAGYEHPEQVVAAAEAILARYDPGLTIINGGATSDGIGAVYKLAKIRGFQTCGIVSTAAQRSGAAISPHVDHVMFVEDKSWGGFLDGSNQLSRTSQAMVEVSDIIIAIGGGEVTRDELIVARRLGKQVEYIPAEMSHAIAITKARQCDAPAPTDFKGVAHEALTQQSRDCSQAGA